MKNKVLITLVVPFISMSYDIYIPINERVDVIISLILKGLEDINQGAFDNDGGTFVLLDSNNGRAFDNNAIVRSLNIKNGTKIILAKI